jgi:hypothetical protein
VFLRDDPAVFRRVLCAYDNSKIAIVKILGPRLRELTAGFLQLVSHYLFGYHFCLVRRANEKGVVEGLVQYSRQNFLVPVPQVRDFEELNAYLLTRCREDLGRRVRGQTRIKEQLLAEEQLSFLPLPFTPFEACRAQPAQVNSELLVRFDDNDYSVPMEYAYRAMASQSRRRPNRGGVPSSKRARPKRSCTGHFSLCANSMTKRKRDQGSQQTPEPMRSIVPMPLAKCEECPPTCCVAASRRTPDLSGPSFASQSHPAGSVALRKLDTDKESE